jgi:Ankyrin repeat
LQVMMGGDHNHCCYREQISYALYAKFREPKLFRMAVNGDWHLMPARCRSYPKEAAFVHKYPPSDTALHRMLRPAIPSCGGTDGVPIDQLTLDKMNELRIAAVVALLEVCRESALVRDSFGRTPLHWACLNFVECKSGDAASLLLNANPEAVTVVDSEQRTVVHALVARNNVVPVDFLLLLLERYPLVLFWNEDLVGETPIKIVERRRSEIENAESVLKLLSAASNAQLPVNMPILKENVN